MKENKVKKILKNGGTVIGAHVAEVRFPNIVKLFSIAGLTLKKQSFYEVEEKNEN